MDVVPGSETYPVRQDLSQDKHLDGMPFGTVGGVIANHTFPVDGDYVLQATLYRTNVDQTRGLELPHQVEMTVDGERVFLDDDWRRRRPAIPAARTRRPPAAAACCRDPMRSTPRLQVRVHVKAGPTRRHRRVPAALARRRSAQAAALPQLVRHLRRHAACRTSRRWSSRGRSTSSRPGETPSRARVFACRPATPRAGRAVRAADSHDAGAPRLPAAGLGRRRERGRWTSTAPAARAAASSRASSWRCSASSPARSSCSASSAIPPTVSAGAAYRISDVELAIAAVVLPLEQHPGRRAADAAPRATSCGHPPVLEQQVRRMLRDPRATALVDNFAGQWLQLRNLQRATPDNDLFPEFDDNLRQSFRREVELLFGTHHARGPQRARSADGRLHVRRRAAGQALRHPERLRQRTSGGCR